MDAGSAIFDHRWN